MIVGKEMEGRVSLRFVGTCFAVVLNLSGDTCSKVGTIIGRA